MPQSQITEPRIATKGRDIGTRRKAHAQRKEGVQWLSGRVLDSRPRVHGFEPHQYHCVASFSKTHLSLLSTGSTLADPSRHN